MLEIYTTIVRNGTISLVLLLRGKVEYLLRKIDFNTIIQIMR